MRGKSLCMQVLSWGRGGKSQKMHRLRGRGNSAWAVVAFQSGPASHSALWTGRTDSLPGNRVGLSRHGWRVPEVQSEALPNAK